MTKKEKIEAVNNVSKTLMQNKGYIKGMGPKKYRVMDSKHNPVLNIDSFIFDELLKTEQIYLDGLIFKTTIKIGSKIESISDSK